MSVSWSTVWFTGATIVAAIAVSAVFSAIFGVGAAQTLAPAVAVVGLAYKYRQTSDDSDTADRQSVGESGDTNTKQQQQTADLTREHNGESKDSGTPVDELSMPGEQSSLLRSDQQIIEETEEILGDRVMFYDDGDTDVDADDLNLYSEMMLYVIAKQIAAKRGIKDTSEVTVEELRDRTRYKKIEILMFLKVVGTRLKPSRRIPHIDYAEADSLSFEANLKKLPEIAEQAISEKITGELKLWSTISDARWSLAEAERYYEIEREQNPGDGNPTTNNRYSDVEQKVISACTRVADYPIEFDHDSEWSGFIKYAGDTMTYLVEDKPTQVSHCLKRMKRHLKTLEKNIDEKYWK